MSNSVHGHEVMKMMVNSKTSSYTKATLEKAIAENFGPNARFHTCSAENMTAKQLIEFLESKGKFVDSGSGFSTESAKICNH
jgi:probable metal-binding protein